MVSDFWFDQSLAFAGVWLPEDRRPEFRLAWEEAGRRVVRPKLLVVLDASMDLLLERISRRGRAGERGLPREVLDKIRQAILDRAAQPGLGPILRLAYEDPRPALDEALAAVQAMHAGMNDAS